jgi:hypothetical protein
VEARGSPLSKTLSCRTLSSNTFASFSSSRHVTNFDFDLRMTAIRPEKSDA